MRAPDRGTRCAESVTLKLSETTVLRLGATQARLKLSNAYDTNEPDQNPRARDAFTRASLPQQLI